MNYIQKGIALTLLGGILWGLSGVSGQYLLQYRNWEAEWLVPVRMISAGVLTVIIAYLREGQKIFSIFRRPADIVRLFIFGIIGLSMCQYAYFKAIQLSNAGIATVIQYTGPVLIIVYLFLRYQQKPKPKEILAVLFAFAGVFILATHGKTDSLALPPLALFWSIAAAFALAVYNVQPVQLLKTYGTIPVVGFGMTVGSIPLLFLYPPYPIVGDWDVMAALAFGNIVLLGTVVSFLAYLEGVKRVGPAKGSILCSIEPIGSMVFAYMLLGTPFAGMDIIGCALIILTIFLLAKTKETT